MRLNIGHGDAGSSYSQISLKVLESVWVSRNILKAAGMLGRYFLYSWKLKLSDKLDVST